MDIPVAHQASPVKPKHVCPQPKWQDPVRNGYGSKYFEYVQELGDPILTIPAAIQNKSYYTPPGNDSHETLIRLGDADRVIAESPLSIKAAR